MSPRKIASSLSVLALAVAHGCSVEVKHGDSESHFIRCTDDSSFATPPGHLSCASIVSRACIVRRSRLHCATR